MPFKEFLEMILIFVFVFLVSILLGGCAGTQPMVWTKAGATEEQFRRDQMSCRQYGMQSAMARGLAGNMFVEVYIQSETAKCLRGLGYTQETR